MGNSSSISPASGVAAYSMTTPKKDAKATVFCEEVIEELTSKDKWEGKT